MLVQLAVVVLPLCVISAGSSNSCSSGLRDLLHRLPKHAGTHCQFNWTNRAEMIKKVQDRMKHRQKRFIRFNAPVFYFDSDWTWKQSKTEFDTYVWVAKTHDYMLHFPHNFEILSLGTMGIITNNFWKPGGEGEILGQCSTTCINNSGLTTTLRCTITWKDVLEFMNDVTAAHNTEWNYVCHQVNYNVSDIVLDTNSAIPDLLYYWRFLSQMITNRPFFGIGMKKDDFIHYNCFNQDGNLKRKELLMNYYVIMIIAILLWLYSPILIYYFPSSEPTWIKYPQSLNQKEFHCTRKSPVYFVNLIRYCLGYYIGRHGSVKSRVRRLLFISCTFIISSRLFFTKYCSILIIFMIICLVTASITDFWSIYLAHDHPTHFLNIVKYPEGTFRENTKKKEFQLLAHHMKERLCLVLDLQFLELLLTESWRSKIVAESWSQLFSKFPRTIHKLALLFCVSLVIFTCFITSLLVYHFTPAFYFYKQLYFAIATGTSTNLLRHFTSLSPYTRCVITIIIYASVLLLVAYFMVAMMFICYLIAEVTMFTYIGIVLVPSMAFKYITLIGAVSLVLHELTKNLRENYDTLRDQIVETLKNPDHLRHLDRECVSRSLKREEESDGTIKILLKITGKPLKVFLYQDHYGTYLSRSLLDFCLEKCDPLRRKVLFMLVKLLFMTFYLLIAMWVKNVFHKEVEVSSIFSIIQTIAMYFVPNMLQFLAVKSRFGKVDDVDFHRDVHEALINYVKKQ